MKVLFVEDEEIILEPVILMASLQNHYELFTAKSANEALEILDSNKDINLVITDVKMPGISGIELMQTIKTNNPKMKVIAMTGEEIKENSNDELWFDEVKFKPFSKINELIKTYS